MAALFLLRRILLAVAALGLARLAGAQAPTFDLAVYCGTAQSANDNINTSALTTDAQGNTLLVGDFTGTVSFGAFTLTSHAGAYDAFVAKRSPTGTWLWVASGGGPAGSANCGAVVLDALGQVYVTGYFNRNAGRTASTASFGSFTLASTGGADALVAKLDGASGQWLWATSAGSGTANGSDEFVGSPALDATGGLLVVGYFSDFRLLAGPFTLYQVGTGNNSFLARLEAATGTWLQASGLGPTAAYGLALDDQDHVYLTGYFTGATATFGATVLTNASTTYLVTQYNTTIQLSDAFVARLAAGTGQWQWAVRAGGVDAEFLGNPLVRQGRLVVGGTFGRQNDMAVPGAPSPLGSQFGNTTLVSAGKYDVVVASLTDTGQWLWAVRAGGTDLDYFGRLRYDAAGRLLLLGDFYGTSVQLGTLSVPGSSSSSILARLSGGALPALPASTAPAWALYPNPARAAVTVSGLPANQPVQVLDVLGRLVLATRTPAQGPLELALPPGLAPGVYVVRAAGQARPLAVE